MSVLNLCPHGYDRNATQCMRCADPAFDAAQQPGFNIKTYVAMGMGTGASELDRLRAAAIDGHCRKCLCDDCARFYREIDRK